jgi:hypothetical protein
MTEPTIPYDPSEFQQKLSAVQGYLAELRYIDTAMAYMEDEKANWWYSLAPFVGTTSHIEVEYGTTFPFTKRYEVPEDRFLWEDSRKGQVESRLRVLAEEANGWAADGIDDIARRVEPFTWPVGPLYESECVAPVLTAHEDLAWGVSNDFGLLRHSLGRWEGAAADNFADRFYHPFEYTLDSQKRLLLALAGGITSAKAIAESTQHSLMNVVHYTREALREQLQLAAAKAELARQESLRNTLIIGGATAAVFGTIITAGTGLWGISLATAASSGSIASTTIPDGGWVALTLRGATAADLLGAMSAAINQIDSNDYDQHDELRREVQAVLDRVEAVREGSDGEDGPLIPIRPNLVDGVDGNDFYLPDATI